jgi:ATP-dependent helicase/nuclease subunit A
MISEELRVLYVAMTRAKDRLIMTYTSPKVQRDMEILERRMALSDPLLLTGSADCHGRWILMTAIANSAKGWKLVRAKSPTDISETVSDSELTSSVTSEITRKIGSAISFTYQYEAATKTPSKQTATQFKGRDKDEEAAENTQKSRTFNRFRKPSFEDGGITATEHGHAMHTVMQYINFNRCDSAVSVRAEVDRLVKQGYLTIEQGKDVDVDQITAFFATDIGRTIRTSKNILREFKFSVLMECDNLPLDRAEDKILLQGVVDLARISDDCIEIVDFKTDRVTNSTLAVVSETYRDQLEIYSKALSRIFAKPVRSAHLYFFQLDKFIAII